ncbi:MAG: hypothetical protein J5819_10270 [Eubacterium sp.]|nr:hypothetical protein [Eubacterium sp.]
MRPRALVFTVMQKCSVIRSENELWSSLFESKELFQGSMTDGKKSEKGKDQPDGGSVAIRH